jgi:HD-GYP domain-containing protein (c-di-GMP phosphodiesterase class II)
MKDHKNPEKTLPEETTTVTPVLLYDKSLQSKIAQGSDAQQVLDQARAVNGTQLVIQLHRLFGTARVHVRTNAALNRIIVPLRETIQLLAQDQPVVIRHRHYFLYLDDKHLPVTTRYSAIFMEFMESLDLRGIGGVSLSADAQASDLLEFAYVFIDPDLETSSCDAIRQRLREGGVQGIEVEEASVFKVRAGVKQTQRKTLAKNFYGKSIATVSEAMEKIKEGLRPSLKQARRAIQNMVDLVLQDESILLGLTTLRCYNQYTYNHSVNVAILSICLGNRAGYPQDALAELGLAALFHDLGKACISSDILNKPEEFTSQEWQEMRLHPIRGMLSVARLYGIRDFPSRMAAAALEHHMNYNFSGYPKLNVPWEQSITGQIVMITDWYDGVTSSRVYQRALVSPELAVNIMISEMGQTFEPILVKLFVNCIGRIPIGSLVRLDSNEIAVVVRPSTNPQTPDRPQVKLITDALGKPLRMPQDTSDGDAELDLAEMDESGCYKRSILHVVGHTDYRDRMDRHFDTSKFFT